MRLVLIRHAESEHAVNNIVGGTLGCQGRRRAAATPAPRVAGQMAARVPAGVGDTAGLTLAANAAIDLQLHTTYSDGDWTDEQLLDYLISERFSLAAVTDHDRVDTAR
jgi:hypothetical protein